LKITGLKHLKNRFLLVILSEAKNPFIEFFSKRWILRRPDSIGTPQNDNAWQCCRSFGVLLSVVSLLVGFGCKEPTSPDEYSNQVVLNAYLFAAIDRFSVRAENGAYP
jgi:hypothetical protein